MKSVLKIIARIAIILLASLVVVGATVLLTPSNLAGGNAEFGGSRGAPPNAAQMTEQNRPSSDQTQNSAPNGAQASNQGQRNFGRPTRSGGGEGFGERGGGSQGWMQVGLNLLKVCVIVLPFAVVGALLRKRRKVAPAPGV